MAFHCCFFYVCCMHSMQPDAAVRLEDIYFGCSNRRRSVGRLSIEHSPSHHDDGDCSCNDTKWCTPVPTAQFS